MSLVIDTSVIISVIMNENSKTRLIKITEGEELIAPTSIHWEIGNAISAMFKRHRITFPQAKKAIEAYFSIPLKLIEVDLLSCLEISQKLNIYAYDAYFIECASYLKLPLITLDEGLMAAAVNSGVRIIEV